MKATLPRVIFISMEANAGKLCLPAELENVDPDAYAIGVHCAENFRRRVLAYEMDNSNLCSIVHLDQLQGGCYDSHEHRTSNRVSTILRSSVSDDAVHPGRA
jgi:hypothetical protein